MRYAAGVLDLLLIVPACSGTVGILAPSRSVVVSCFFFFFSSRRRHTRLQGDWSSDVCSSDRSEERRVGKGVDLGGRRIIKKKKEKEWKMANIEPKPKALVDVA